MISVSENKLPKLNIMTTRPLRLYRTIALGLFLTLIQTGCASKVVWSGQRQADRNLRLTRGCVFYFDGAGGGTKDKNYGAGVVEGMLEAGYKGAGELMAWETGKGLLKDQVASVEYKRSKAKESAVAIQEYNREHPGAPIELLGFSAGTAQAIFALEALPEAVQVNRVVLLGTSISHDYDLTEALKRVSGKLYIFTSPHDRMVGTMMKLSGTADRKFRDAGAGVNGFVLPQGASEATKQLYASKIVTIPYDESFKKDGDKGHHFDNVKKDFIREHVAPLLMER